MKRNISQFANKQHALRIVAMLVSGACVTQLGAQITVEASAQVDSLEATNGSKISAGRWGLHTVYVKAGAIYYSWSANSQTWSPGAAITGSGVSQPSIAVASDGTVGVVYRDGSGNLEYLSCKPAGNAPCKSWSSPYWVGLGWHPSLTAFQNDMYLAAASGGIVTYTKFAAALTGNLTWSNIEYAFWNSGTCYQDTVDFPAVTVMPLPIAGPEIRVSWLQKSVNGVCNYPDFMGVFSAKRQSQGWGSPDSLYSVSLSANVPADIYSLSAAANAGTGEQFVAASLMAYNIPYTFVFRRSQGGIWYKTTFNGKSLISIASNGSSCSPQFRIALTMPTSGKYGNTYYWDGSWTGAAATPSWSGWPVQVDQAGTSPQASFWTSPWYFAGGSVYAYITPIFYAGSVGGTAEKVEIQTLKTNVGFAACPPPPAF